MQFQQPENPPDPPVEEIPNADEISRQIFDPQMFEGSKLSWEKVFIFPTNKDTKEYYGESVVWRKYAPELDDVHELGCKLEAIKRDRRPQTPASYVGAPTATCATVRQLKNARGSGFAVVHDPSDGQGLHHSEIRLFRADGKVARSEREELIMMLQGAFGAVAPHQCPPA